MQVVKVILSHDSTASVACCLTFDGINSEKRLVLTIFPSSGLPTESSNEGQSQRATCVGSLTHFSLTCWCAMIGDSLSFVSALACTVHGHDEQVASQPPADHQLHGADDTRTAMHSLRITCLLMTDMQSGKQSLVCKSTQECCQMRRHSSADSHVMSDYLRA
jgi:hypothetical protein